MNPFEWRGPQFLVFYVVLSVATIVLLRLRRSMVESRPPGLIPKFTDPYLIAYLRGGKKAVVQTALLSMSTRQLIKIDSKAIHPNVGPRSAQVKHPLESQILQGVSPTLPVEKIDRLDVGPLTKQYDTELRQLELLPTASQQTARWFDFLIVASLMVAVSWMKISIALAAGRTNIEFLCALTVVFLLLAAKFAHPRLTVAGDQVVSVLENLLNNSRERVQSAGRAPDMQDMVMVAAVFGVLAVPEEAFPARSYLFPKPTSSSSGDGGSSSSCGSSCSSSCGGGGGGCGGCGS